MSSRNGLLAAVIWLAVLTFSGLAVHPARGQGMALTGVGPINRSMGGASTAAPIEALGALHWNPGSISGLDGSEVGIGMEFLLPSEELSSSVTAPFPFSGSDRGEPGVSVIPSIGCVHKTDSAWTWGLGVYAIGGFRVNYPSSTPAGTGNPILFPQALGGLGRIFAEAQFMQIAPTIAYALTDQLSIGVSPTVTLGQIALDPLFIAPPAPGLGYTSGRATRWHWGGGVQAGVYYIATPQLRLGASIKSPQWFEDFRFFTEDGAGGTRVAKLDLDYPMIISLGGSYTRDNLLLAVDVRYFDYKSADGFGSAGTFTNGALNGLDWSSLVSVSTGLQVQVSDQLFVRSGYTYQQNPIRSSETFVNVASPLIIEHVLALGATYRVSCRVNLALTYIHGFENQSRGAIPTGGTVSSTISADALSFGLNVKY